MKIAITVNGEETDADIEPRLLLVHYLREVLGLRATNIGCDTTSCGACTVLVDGESVKSCTVLAAQASGGTVTTVEGLRENDSAPLHPVQSAFVQCHGLQCGFCTPGMIMASSYYLRQQPSLDEESICHALEGNICRCTGYVNIIEAVRHAAHAMYPSLGDATTEDATR